MEKSFTLIQTIATAGAFSAISFWCDFTSLSSTLMPHFFSGSRSSIRLAPFSLGMDSCLEESPLEKTWEI